MLNTCTLIGNVGKQPEIGVFETGSGWAKFSLATEKSFKNKEGEKSTETTWHNIVAFGPVVDVISKYVKKGQQICIRGEIRNRSYENREGEKRYISEVLVRDLVLLRGNRESNSAHPPPENESNSNTTHDNYDNQVEPEDDLPF